MRTKQQRVAKEIARVLGEHRRELSAAFYEAVCQIQGLRQSPPLAFCDLDEYRQELFLTAVDLVGAATETAESLYSDLLVGWIAAQLIAVPAFSGAPTGQAMGPASMQLVRAVRDAWTLILCPALSSTGLEHLDAFLGRVATALSFEPRRTLRILFIGDCLSAEISAALVGPCLQQGIGIECHFLHEKVPPVLRNRIRTLEPHVFDVVFFSPFSHRYAPDYSVLLDWTTALWSRGRLEPAIARWTEEVSITARVVAAHFRCPVYVHNTAGTVQTFGILSGVAKNLISWRNSRRVRAYVRDRLHVWLSTVGDEQVRLIDETSLLANASRWSLGRVVFEGNLLHPTQLGLGLARGAYRDAIVTTALLSTKKVVVCDLDNTLWDGVIGEGPVTHFEDRQTILKGLRQKGVLLSINSKNDSKNVEFNHAVLQARDFVAPRINWRPKTENMAAIVQELNLKPKDFVFIDDRPDELERMRSAFPHIVTLDATQPSTWRWLEHWRANLLDFNEEDRTRVYHEKVDRDSFLVQEQSPEDESAALKKLGLVVKIEVVEGSALKRVAELVNRTNQFNLCGSRTSVAELEPSLRSNHVVLSVAAKDKFGSMGVVGAMRVDLLDNRLEIPIFVLSCRVFGFGIEYALLATAKLFAFSDTVIVGHYKETSHNAPARDLYPKSGLNWDGGAWIGRVGELPDDPAWLSVERPTPMRTMSAQIRESA